MKLACMLYSLYRALSDKTITVAQAFALIHELGGEGVDLGTAMAEHTNAELRRMAKDAGLVVSCVIGGANLTTDDPAQQAQSLDEVRRAVDAAVELDSKIVLITPGVCAPGQSGTDARRNVASVLAELLPYARSADVTVTIEDYGSPTAAYQTSAECMECCELAGPELMMTYDSGNMIFADEDPVHFLQAVESRMAYVHMKDWEPIPADADYGLVSRSGKRYSGTVVGQGVLDYPAIFAAIRAIGYEGYVSFEYEGREDPVEAARQGMGYLKDLMA